MGIKDLLKKKEAVDKRQEIICQPVRGKLIPLEEIEDDVFSAGIIGRGCGIYPEDGALCSPVNGVVSLMAETKHAVGIKSTGGVEILIHIGLDTVEMCGKGFEVIAKEGEDVSIGQPILTFSREEIAAAGYKDTVAVLVTNSAEFKNVELLKLGEGSVGDPMLRIQM